MLARCMTIVASLQYFAPETAREMHIYDYVTVGMRLACASRSWYGENFDRKGNRDHGHRQCLNATTHSQLHVTCFVVVHLLHPYGSSAASVQLASFVLSSTSIGMKITLHIDTDSVNTARPFRHLPVFRLLSARVWSCIAVQHLVCSLSPLH